LPASKKTSSKPSSKNRRKLWLLVLTPAVLIVLGVATSVTAMSFENHDDFCASCHSEPESAYFKRESAASIDLASFHSTKDVHCIDCHSGQGVVPGRLSAMMLGAKDLLAWVSGHSTQPAVSTRPIDDMNCLKCHGDVLQRRDFNNHFHVFLPRWQAVSKNAADCIRCHQGHTTTGEAQLGFLNQATTVNVCQACHNTLGGRD
jgi:predicted CXXCH cytochrome family protein